MEKKIRIGVIGAGHLGKIHLRLLSEIPFFELLGFYDTNPLVQKTVFEEMGIKSWGNRQELIEACDAIDIVSPTPTHFEVAKAALRNFKHTFIEKPVSTTLEEVRELQGLVREAKVKVQVGHLERFNSAFLAVKDQIQNPMYIESQRHAHWSARGPEVSILFDLMIHDIDIVLSLVKSSIRKVSATGISVISDSPDIANARIEFHNGCVVHLSASRMGAKNLRTMRLFQKSKGFSIDFLEKRAEISMLAAPKPETDSLFAGTILSHEGAGKILKTEILTPPFTNSIKSELEAFGKSILNDTPTLVNLEEAAMALDAALQVEEKIMSIH